MKQYFFRQRMYATPGQDQSKSDKDFGDDEASEFNNLGRHQLLAATLKIQNETGKKNYR